MTMLRKAFSFFALAGFALPSVAECGFITLNASDRGQYHNAGGLTPDNYAVGDPVTNSFAETRNFFVFDLSTVSETIISAQLLLENPVVGSFNGFGSVDPTEDFELFSVATGATALVNGTAGIAGFNDLGTGTSYGVRTVSNADNGTILSFSLNSAALSDLNNSNGLFVFGGAIRTLNGVTANEREQLFGGTNSTHITHLRLQTETNVVPEPTSLAAFGIGALAMSGIGIARRRKLRRAAPETDAQ